MDRKDAEKIFKNIQDEKMVEIALRVLLSPSPLVNLKIRCEDIISNRLDELEKRKAQ